MSAARLALAWDTQNEGSMAIELVTPPASKWVREIAPSRRLARCPECNSIIYSRRHRLCGVCSQPLPEDLLFSLGEARRVEGLLSVERQRHRKWMEQRTARSR